MRTLLVLACLVVAAGCPSSCRDDVAPPPPSVGVDELDATVTDAVAAFRGERSPPAWFAVPGVPAKPNELPLPVPPLFGLSEVTPGDGPYGKKITGFVGTAQASTKTQPFYKRALERLGFAVTTKRRGDTTTLLGVGAEGTCTVSLTPQVRGAEVFATLVICRK